MILISSISDIDWCSCKWVENRGRFRSFQVDLGLAVLSGDRPPHWAAQLNVSQLRWPILTTRASTRCRAQTATSLPLTTQVANGIQLANCHTARQWHTVC